LQAATYTGDNPNITGRDSFGGFQTEFQSEICTAQEQLEALYGEDVGELEAASVLYTDIAREIAEELGISY